MIVRSSYVSTFKKCPRLAYYKYHLGLNESPSPEIYFGTKLHEALAKLHTRGVDSAIATFNDYNVDMCDKLHNPTIGKLLLEKYLTSNPPKPLVVEEEFQFRVGEHVWRGRFDGIARVGEGLYVIEHKTTKWRFRTTKPNDQLVAYFLGGRACYPEMQGVIVNEFSLQTRSVTSIPITYTLDELGEWLDEMEHLLMFMSRCLERDVFPRNPLACHLWDGECSYLQLCKASRGLRERLYKTYEINEEWKEMSW